MTNTQAHANRVTENLMNTLLEMNEFKLAWKVGVMNYKIAVFRSKAAAVRRKQDKLMKELEALNIDVTVALARMEMKNL